MRRALLQAAVIALSVVGTLVVQSVLEYRAWHRKMALSVAKGITEVEVIRRLGFPTSIEHGEASPILFKFPENCDVKSVRRTFHYVPEHGGVYRSLFFDSDHHLLCEDSGAIWL